MTLNPERISSVNPLKSLEWNWKWEKKHWLLVISVACLALWWCGASLTEFSLIKPLIASLPFIGSLCFAAEAILKLSS
jgi:apolipoprotein N-acyltransferase